MSSPQIVQQQQPQPQQIEMMTQAPSSIATEQPKAQEQMMPKPEETVGLRGGGDLCCVSATRSVFVPAEKTADIAVSGPATLVSIRTAKYDNEDKHSWPQRKSLLVAETPPFKSIIGQTAMTISDSKPTILVIDAYDSFTNNIISLLAIDIDCNIRVIQIDTPISDADLKHELQYYDAVVCGPGPGDPSNDRDAGLMKRIWKLADIDPIPVLGICLGFQSLALAYGASIRELNQGLHGMIRRIDHIGQATDSKLDTEKDIFEGIGNLEATLYHSLCIDDGHETHDAEIFRGTMWQPTSICPQLQPLAWCIQKDAQDSRILMAIKHKTKPFWGVQYHLESICTNPEGKKLIKSWYESARRWNDRHSRPMKREQKNCALSLGQPSVPLSLLAQYQQDALFPSGHKISSDPARLLWKVVDIPTGLRVSVPDLALYMNVEETSQIILESTNANLPTPLPGMVDVRGRYSIIALNVDSSMQVQYTCGKDHFLLRMPRHLKEAGESNEYKQIPLKTSIWSHLAWIAKHKGLSPDVSHPDIPFRGGFLGFTTYEMGLEDINVNIGRTTQQQQDLTLQRPDLHFAWITSSLVIDHQENKIYVQKIEQEETDVGCTEGSRPKSIAFEKLCSRISRFLDLIRCRKESVGSPRTDTKFPAKIDFPSSSRYEDNVVKCQDHIRAGESYELCLTAQTHVTLDPNSRADALDIYKQLSHSQPAPMASYIRLGQCSYISASPERFLTWDATGKCSLRPMKGTVKKTPTVTSLAQASELLNVPKERAENLMIVDLVRHDLHSICGPGNVTVPKLMEIEEYASVYQMITEVQGQIPKTKSSGCGTNAGYTGIDVLAASLPPGSMTGAPKKRSCELLRDLEGGVNRSLYSGVVGYIDAAGRGDFSVNIRCLYKWDGEDAWHVGAGGAVTGLSTAVGERDEMLAKLSGTLSLFEQV